MVQVATRANGRASSLHTDVTCFAVLLTHAHFSWLWSLH